MGKILLIDDERDLLDLVGGFLEEESFDVVTAVDGEDGFEKFMNNDDVNVVVCDVNMPKMKGLEVIKKIREQNSDIAFIFFTGFGSRENMLEAAKYGAYDFIEKPDVTGLLDAVKSAMAAKQNNLCEKKEHLSEYQKLLSSHK